MRSLVIDYLGKEDGSDRLRQLDKRVRVASAEASLRESKAKYRTKEIQVITTVQTKVCFHFGERFTSICNGNDQETKQVVIKKLAVAIALIKPSYKTFASTRFPQVYNSWCGSLRYSSLILV